MANWEVVTGSHPDGEISFPLVRVKGEASGPTLAVIAGVHGAEYIGIEAARRLCEIEPGQLRGCLNIVPVANVPGFLNKSIAICPIDGENMGRFFPGQKASGYSAALAGLIWDFAIADADYVIDLHGGDMHETLTAYSSWAVTGDEGVDRVSREMAEAFDMPFIQLHPQPREFKGGSAYVAGAHHKKPGILAEAGSHGEVDENLISNTHYRGLLNVLRYLKMLPGEISRRHTPRLLSRFESVISPLDGYFYPVVTAGQTVAAGQIVGEVIDVFHRDKKTLIAPADAVVLGLVTTLAVEKGRLALGLGVLA